MLKLSEEFTAKKREAADHAAEMYIQSLYDLLQCIDMSADGSIKAHSILNAIELLQKAHAIIERPDPERHEMHMPLQGVEESSDAI